MPSVRKEGHHREASTYSHSAPGVNHCFWSLQTARNIGKSAKVLKSELSDLSEDGSNKQVTAGPQNPQIPATPSSPAPTQNNVQNSSPQVASGQSDTADPPENN